MCCNLGGIWLCIHPSFSRIAPFTTHPVPGLVPSTERSHMLWSIRTGMAVGDEETARSRLGNLWVINTISSAADNALPLPAWPHIPKLSFVRDEEVTTRRVEFG